MALAFLYKNNAFDSGDSASRGDPVLDSGASTTAACVISRPKPFVSCLVTPIAARAPPRFQDKFAVYVINMEAEPVQICFIERLSCSRARFRVRNAKLMTSLVGGVLLLLFLFLCVKEKLGTFYRQAEEHLFAASQPLAVGPNGNGVCFRSCLQRYAARRVTSLHCMAIRRVQYK